MNKQYKIDLHTHSTMSRDGGITRDQYKLILSSGVLDAVAITDHNEIGFALSLHKEIGNKIIVGEEITTLDGEIIGLYLQEKIEPGLSVVETVRRIKDQNGIIYIPHPFETLRAGLKINELKKILYNIDIIEVFNSRGRFRGKSSNAGLFAIENDLAQASSSDAHCKLGIGSSYSSVNQISDKKSILSALRNGRLEKKYSPILSYLCPSFNRIKNRLLF